ncbi:hypothetical protein OH77DRAFT_91317 [Trametes cingulata]|nr:hypothetical protein OH77DRAFT_91317 [Trametes cingulata]
MAARCPPSTPAVFPSLLTLWPRSCLGWCICCGLAADSDRSVSFLRFLFPPLLCRRSEPSSLARSSSSLASEMCPVRTRRRKALHSALAPTLRASSTRTTSLPLFPCAPPASRHPQARLLLVALESWSCEVCALWVHVHTTSRPYAASSVASLHPRCVVILGTRLCAVYAHSPSQPGSWAFRLVPAIVLTICADTPLCPATPVCVGSCTILRSQTRTVCETLSWLLRSHSRGFPHPLRGFSVVARHDDSGVVQAACHSSEAEAPPLVPQLHLRSGRCVGRGFSVYTRCCSSPRAWSVQPTTCAATTGRSELWQKVMPVQGGCASHYVGYRHHAQWASRTACPTARSMAG